MDQKKTGQFIAALRRNRNMTQGQLAEKLDISEKTISKWECGNGLPEVTYMETLCEILGITVNELLMGERIDIARLLHKLDCTRLELCLCASLHNCIMSIYWKEAGMEAVIGLEKFHNWKSSWNGIYCHRILYCLRFV